MNLGGSEEQPDLSEASTISGSITDLRTMMIDGTTWYYLQIDDSSKYYKASGAEFEDLILADVGDTVKISCYEGMNEFVRILSLELQ